MASSDLKFLSLLGLLTFLFSASLPSLARAANGRVLAEYIGTEFNNVKFSDVPINPNVDFRFILSFAIDYKVTGHTASATNGHFSVFWDTDFLTAAQVRLIKQKHPNVRVAVSLGGDIVDAHGKQIPVRFHADSVDSWVRNAVTSLTAIIKKYNLDGMDIDYEHFSSSATPTVFADCIGQLITTLRKNHVIQFASIAPFDDVQSHYLALWKKYGHAIDYVNFQFYTYSKETTVPQFLSHFNHASSVYSGGKVLASFSTDNSGGLKPKPRNGGFFEACRKLKSQGKLHGIMIWAADYSKELKADAGFRYETTAQKILA